jgi:fumarylacetoacetase
MIFYFQDSAGPARALLTMTDLNDTHDPALRSWVETANLPGTDFPIQNLPFGVFRTAGSEAAGEVGVAIGDQILSLRRAAEHGALEEVSPAIRDACRPSTLNALMALGNTEVSHLRRQLSRLLRFDSPNTHPQFLVAMADAHLDLPVAIGNYSDFYASIFHATNVGRLFRPDNPLLPNYKYVPIAYHGRSSSIIISGTPIRRPIGQVKGPTGDPVVQPSDRLDYEAEIGCFASTGNALGHPIPITEAEQHIFGLCLVNDWSARDIQAWEYQPLGPFLAKSFGTTISPWIVTHEALAPFRCPAFVRAPADPPPLDYLFSEADRDEGGFDVTVEVSLRSEEMRRQGHAATVISRSSLRDAYWTLAQMVTHHTSNGCNLIPGDLLASGTLSGPEKDSRACLLEMTNGGTTPLGLPTGERRTFLANGDEVIMRARCERTGYVSIGFGDCVGIVV